MHRALVREAEQTAARTIAEAAPSTDSVRTVSENKTPSDPAPQLSTEVEAPLGQLPQSTAVPQSVLPEAALAREDIPQSQLALVPNTDALTAPLANTLEGPETRREAAQATSALAGVDYVAMGDSYASGEGNPPYFGRTDCHRSKAAYPWRLSIALSLLLTETTHVACTGAKSFDIWRPQVLAAGDIPVPPQINALTSTTDLVTVTVGGNDLRFADTLEKCVKDRTDCDRELSARGPGLLRILETSLDIAYTKIDEKLGAVGSNADVVVVGYPRLFPKNPTDQQVASCQAVKNPVFAPTTRLFLGPGISAKEMKAFNALQTQVNMTIRRVAERHEFSFVNVEDAFTGHEICTEAPYINGVIPESFLPFYPFFEADPASFHPNASGHQAIADIVKQQLAEEVAVPAAPTLLSVNPVCPDTFRLTWRDNSSNESGFNIYDDGVLVGTVGPNVQSFDDEFGGFLGGSRHFYRVSAFNAAGESPRSNEIFASFICRAN